MPFNIPNELSREEKSWFYSEILGRRYDQEWSLTRYLRDFFTLSSSFDSQTIKAALTKEHKSVVIRVLKKNPLLAKKCLDLDFAMAHSDAIDMELLSGAFKADDVFARCQGFSKKKTISYLKKFLSDESIEKWVFSTLGAKDAADFFVSKKQINGPAHLRILSIYYQMFPNKVNQPIYLNGSTPLMFAAENGHTDIVGMLLKIPGIDVNQANNFASTALMFAAKNGHAEIVEMLLKIPGIDVNKANNNGWTALMLAAENGHTKIVEMLLKIPGIDVNQANNFASTALMFAAKNGHTKIVEMLLKIPGFDINQANNFGLTALMFAASYGHTKVVEMLLKIPGIDINQANIFGSTALIFAAQVGHADIVEMLLKIPGIEVNKADNNGSTALMFAAYHGHTKIVEMLLKIPGIHVNKGKDQRWGALMFAAERGHADVVRALLEMSQIDCDDRDPSGRNAFHIALDHRHYSICSLLLLSPRPMTFETEFLRKIPKFLFDAVRDGDLEQLIEVNPSCLSAVDLYGNTILFYASTFSKPKSNEILNKILDLGADPNHKNHGGETALDQACRLNNQENIRSLINHPLIDTQRALVVAAQFGNKRLAAKLLKKGAEISGDVLAAAAAHPDVLSYFILYLKGTLIPKVRPLVKRRQYPISKSSYPMRALRSGFFLRLEQKMQLIFSSVKGK